MLGVLKRRWKPKRSISGSTIPSNDTNSLDSFERDKPQLRQHQVHPVLDSQVLVCYDKQSSETGESTASSQICYPLVPNICVEAGRIQFIQREADGNFSPVLDEVSSVGRVTVTRGQQTDNNEEDEHKEIQTSLENRIAELEALLEEAQKKDLRYRQTIKVLKKQIDQRESAKNEADRERILHAESEIRTKQALLEAAHCRSRLKILTNEFAKMEETVRTMLMYKKQVEQLRQEKASITVTYENRCQHYQNTISKLNTEISGLKKQLKQMSKEKYPESIIQAQTEALHNHIEEARRQYEKCLDDVANQVVRALLAQKGLREEVEFLNKRIKELENQNRVLTSTLVTQLGHDKYVTSEFLISPSDKLENSTERKQENSEDCTDGADIDIDKRLSLADKKRHQVLTNIWTEMRKTDLTQKILIEALNSNIDSNIWMPPKRPVSLNLHLPIFQTSKLKRIKSVIAQNQTKNKDGVGSESPESGNRDEGYSTMSSDIQADLNKRLGTNTLPRICLEELKEASYESDNLLSTDADPDILYIPFNLYKLSQRNSYPPGKDVVPFQHALRSFSDSHLCIKITTAPTPCYKFNSPISSSPSILLLDILDKPLNPLRRTQGTNNLWGYSNIERNEDKVSSTSWSSAENHFESVMRDAEYIQHWLHLDETRSTVQQQHRDMLELEYDKAELEDWSLSLSSDDLQEQWKKSDVNTPGQLSVSTLPSIQENILELEEDSNEFLWNSSSYMVDTDGEDLSALLKNNSNNEVQWPYAVPEVTQQISPDNSWSSGVSDFCHSFEPDNSSKRSSAVLSGSSDDTGELPGIGTDFTRDFYRLVKFESTKSLASSSRSVGGTDIGDRETTLHNMLSFITKQAKHCQPEIKSCSSTEGTKDFNIEGPALLFNEIPVSESGYSIRSDVKFNDDENYVTLKQLCEEFTELKKEELVTDCIKQNITYAEERCLVTPIDVESENCSNMGEHPVDICSSVNVEPAIDDDEEVATDSTKTSDVYVTVVSTDISNSFSDISLNTSESLTSSVSTPETIVSKIPRRKSTKTQITPSITANNNNYNKENLQDKSKPKNIIDKRCRSKIKII